MPAEAGCSPLHSFREDSTLAKNVCGLLFPPSRSTGCSRAAREAALREKWNEGVDEIDTLLNKHRYARLYELLKSGRVEINVVSAADAPFLHGKAGVIESRDGTVTAFIGSSNETAEGWDRHYEIVWEDRSPKELSG